MKQAYVSVILPFSGKVPSAREINALDAELRTSTRNHELILIDTFDSGLINLELNDLYGPLSIVYTNSVSSQNSSRIAAFGRAAGDFIIEWQGPTEYLTKNTILELLEPTSAAEVPHRHDRAGSHQYQRVGVAPSL